MGIGEWLGLLGVVLALVALPTAFQMFFGRPTIEFVCSVEHGDKGSILQCRLLNPAIENRFLKWLGVRREAAYIHAAYKIWSQETGELIVDLTAPLLVSTTDNAQALELRPTLFGVTFALVLCNQQGVFALAEKPNKEVIRLDPGNYNAPVVVFCGEKRFVKNCAFVVTSNPMNSYWSDD